ncbi:hypothetical protein M885DRAFT_512938 [Pelagophyceae sp. CCMP2097]|nr:hypothetical protein M885DRAFT_512938 [Pelagophyceae sp. CCMP2097]
MVAMLAALVAAELCAAAPVVVVHAHALPPALAARLDRSRVELRGYAPLVVVTNGFRLPETFAAGRADETQLFVVSADESEAAVVNSLPSVNGALANNADPGWSGDRGLLYAFQALHSKLKADYYWNVEHDVGWTGDLGALLRGWENSTADLICADLQNVDANWAHGVQRDTGDWLAEEDARHCLMTVSRVSARLLHQIIKVAAEPGRKAYLEMRSASECARHKRLFDNCTAVDLFSTRKQATHRGALFTYTGSRLHQRYHSKQRIFGAMDAARNASRSQFFHPLKESVHRFSADYAKRRQRRPRPNAAPAAGTAPSVLASEP